MSPIQNFKASYLDEGINVPRQTEPYTIDASM